MEPRTKSRIRLKIDIDALLPGDELMIGNESITIRPLSIVQYKLIVGKIRSFLDYMKVKGITGDNYKETESLISIAEIVIEKFPDLLAEISNIDEEDLQELPIDIIVALIDKCLDVNLKSKDSLLGNFKSLIGKVSLLGIADMTKTQDSEAQVIPETPAQS